MPILSNPFIGGHHALNWCHALRDTLFESCKQAGVGSQMEVGSGLGHDE